MLISHHVLIYCSYRIVSQYIAHIASCLNILLISHHVSIYCSYRIIAYNISHTLCFHIAHISHHVITFCRIGVLLFKISNNNILQAFLIYWPSWVIQFLIMHFTKFNFLLTKLRHHHLKGGQNFLTRWLMKFWTLSENRIGQYI